MAEVLRRGQKFTEEREIDWAPGRKRVILSISDLNYQDENAVWHPLDETFEPDGQDGFVVKSQKARHKLRVDSGGARRWYPRRNIDSQYATAGKPQYWGNNSWRNLQLGPAVQDGNSISFDTAEISMRIYFTWEKVKFDLVLKTPSAPTSFRFPIDLTGLQWDGWDLKDGTDTVGTLTPSTAFDANEASVPLSESIDAGYIYLSVEPGAAVYPIEIDPTFTTPQTTNTQDTYLHETNSDTNYSTEVSMNVGREANTSFLRSLVRFDLSPVPAGSTVTAAEFFLYNVYNDSNIGRSMSCFSIRPERDWVEGQATWNSYKTGNSWGTAGVSNISTDRYDVSICNFSGSNTAPVWVSGLIDNATVEGWCGEASNPGFLIKSNEEGVNWSKNEFRASNWTTPTQRPYLVVEYTEGGGPVEESVSLGKSLGAYIPNSPFHTLTDNFDDNAINTALWSKGMYVAAYHDPDVSVVEADGKLTITPRSNLSGNRYSGYLSNDRYNLYDGSVHVEVAQATVDSDYPSTELVLTAENVYQGNEVSMVKYGTILHFRHEVNSVTNNASIPYNSADHRWWRIRHAASDDTIRYDTSPNGVTWTERRSVARGGINLLGMQANIMAGTWFSIATPGVAIFDNLNYLSGIEESVSLGISLRCAEPIVQSEEGSASAARLHGLTISNQAQAAETISEARSLDVSASSQSVFSESVSLGKASGISHLEQLAAGNDASLDKTTALSASADTGAVEASLSLNRLGGIAHADTVSASSELYVNKTGAVSQSDHLSASGSVSVAGNYSAYSESDISALSDISLARSNAVSTADLAVLYGEAALGKLSSITGEEELQSVTVEESVTLGITLRCADTIVQSNDVSVLIAKQAGIHFETQVEHAVSVALDKSSSASAADNADLISHVAVAKSAAVSALEDTDIEAALTLARSADVSTQDLGVLASSVDINRGLDLFADDLIVLLASVSLDRAVAVDTQDQIDLGASVDLDRAAYINTASQSELSSGVSADKASGIDAQSQAVLGEEATAERTASIDVQSGSYHSASVSLERSGAVDTSSEASAEDSISIGKIAEVTEASTGNLQDTLNLHRVVAVLSEPDTGEIIESVSLGRSLEIVENGQAFTQSDVSFDRTQSVAISSSSEADETVSLGKSSALSIVSISDLSDTVSLERTSSVYAVADSMTVEESVSLGISLQCAEILNPPNLESLTEARSMGVAIQSDVVFAASVTLSRISAENNQTQLTASDSVAVERSLYIAAMFAGGIVTESISLDRQTGLSTSSQVAFASSIMLARTISESTEEQIAFAVSVALSRTESAIAYGQISAVDALSIERSLSLHAFVAGGLAEESISLGRQVGVLPSYEAVYSASVTLLRQSSVLLASQLQAGNLLSLSRSLTAFPYALGLSVDEAVSLNRLSGDTRSGNALVQASAGLARSSSAEASSQASIFAGMDLVTLWMLSVLSQAANDAHELAPGERVYLVGRENRTISVSMESRTASVSPESRISGVSYESRTAKIDAEIRINKVKR